MAVKFLELSRGPVGETTGKFARGAIKGAATGAVLGSVVPGVGTAAGALAGGAIGGGAASISTAIQGVENLSNAFIAHFAPGSPLARALDGLLSKAGIDMDAVRARVAEFMLVDFPEWIGGVKENFAKFFNDTLPALWGIMVEKTVEAWDTIKAFITVAIPEAVTTAWTTLKDFVTGIPDEIESAWDSLKTFFTVDVVGWFSPLIDTFKSIKEWIDKINIFGGGDTKPASSSGGNGFFSTIGDVVKDLFKPKGEGQTGLGFVPEDGLFKLHRGEKVTPATRVSPSAGAGGRPISTTINFTGGINQEIDVDALSRRAARLTEMSLRRRARL